MFGTRKKSKLATVVDSTRVATRRSSAALTAEMDELLSSLADKVADARSTLTDLAGEGATAASESLDRVDEHRLSQDRVVLLRHAEPGARSAAAGGDQGVEAAHVAPSVVSRIDDQISFAMRSSSRGRKPARS